jgi:hypothetical protein
MANTLKVIDMVAKEALRIAHEKCSFIGTVYRGYDESYSKKGAKIGDTLRIRNPNQYTRRTGSRDHVGAGPERGHAELGGGHAGRRGHEVQQRRTVAVHR